MIRTFPFVRLLQVARTELGSPLGEDALLLQAEVKAKTSTVSVGLMGIAGGVILLLCIAVTIASLILFIVSFGIAPLSQHLSSRCHLGR